jgi:hypothetical protein
MSDFLFLSSYNSQFKQQLKYIDNLIDCTIKLEDENKKLKNLLKRHLADNLYDDKNYCNCQLCQDTRAALEKEE